MTKLSKSDLLPYHEYKKHHENFLKKVIQEKKVRRVQISDKMTGLFESKLTVFYQIQEMIRAEEITNEEYIEEMLDVYNDLLPGKNELSMTLFIEIPNKDELRAFNKTVVGIEKHVQIIFGEYTISSYEPNTEADDEEGYTQSVHYIHFPFNDESKKAFVNHQGNVSLRVNHPNYQAEVQLKQELVSELISQLNAQTE